MSMGLDETQQGGSRQRLVMHKVKDLSVQLGVTLEVTQRDAFQLCSDSRPA